MCEVGGIGVSAESIRDALGRLDRLIAEITDAVGAFDAAKLWDLEGAASMTAWLKAEGLSGREASRLSKNAKRLRDLPVTSSAWRSGELSGGQVEAIVANVGGATAAFAEEEAELVPLLAPLTVAQVGQAMQTWRLHLDDADLPEEPERHLHLSPTLDGRHELQGSFDAEGGAVIATALAVAGVDDREKSVSEKQADALVAVCRFFLDNQETAVGGRHRPHLNLSADLETFEGGIVDGPRLDVTAIKRILCDAGVHRVVTAGKSEILDYGRMVRTVPAPLWSALVERDGHCRFPHCDRRSSWCEAHHVKHWSDGGSTSLDNLVLLCSRHHHVCHRRGWEAKLLLDGTFEVTRPP